MPLPDPSSIFDAQRMSQSRTVMTTSLSTEELRDLGADVLARSVFTARGANAIFVSKLKEVVDLGAAGKMGEGQMRTAIWECLKATGYTPEGGFPDAPPGEVPPAVRGTLQDLMSFRRLDLIVRTQLELMRGAGQQWRGILPESLTAYPAWELVRIADREVPRHWPSRWEIAGGGWLSDAVIAKLQADYDRKSAEAEKRHDAEQETFASSERNYSNVKWLEFERRWSAFWVRLGSRPTTRSIMIALKGDPVWGELGSYENFEDALGVDHPPFAFNSGMGWREVSAADCAELGITGPDGQSIEEFHAGIERPRVMLGQLPLPAPRMSLEGVDPELIDRFKAETHATAVPGKPFTVDYSDLLARDIAARDGKGGGQ